ncbi:MAG: alpha/beta hydrolase [Rhabdochlamydiaceae bacterium]|nr:alpha/beta hydrolase [Rhabdochlamydiaceae bacterium]
MNWVKISICIVFLGIEGLTSNQSPFSERTIIEWRQATTSFGKDIGEAANVSFIDRSICARDGYPLACRIFNDQLPSDTPVFVFYPGCAFLFDFFEVNSVIASRIAEKSGIKVVLVQFRLAPEHSVLTSLSDSYDAACYIALHSGLFGVNPSKFFVGGWCSGANAATFVSKMACETKEFTIQRQILLGGSFDLSHSFHSFDEYEARDITLSRSLVAHLAQLFYSMDSDKNPLFSPYWNEDFTNFPPTTLLCGEYDALRNDSEAFFEKLLMANVLVEKIILDGQSHNEVVMQALPSAYSDPTVEIAMVLRKNI